MADCFGINQPEAEFKEFEPQLKFETRLNCGWFHLKLYAMFQDLSRRLKPGFGGFDISKISLINH